MEGRLYCVTVRDLHLISRQFSNEETKQIISEAWFFFALFSLPCKKKRKKKMKKINEMSTDSPGEEKKKRRSIVKKSKSAAAILKASKQDNKASSL